MKNLKEIYSLFVFFVALVVGSYKGYTDIIDNIKRNTTSLESTQITMLKSIVRDFEKNHKCDISSAEWDEYIVNYSTLFDLKVKYKSLSKQAQWMPIKRKTGECE